LTVLDEELFHCFVSRAQVGGKTVRVDVEASERLKFEAVFRGFTTKKKVPKKNLTAWDRIVILMREATSADGFNHESWAAEISKPAWMRRFDTLFGQSWLNFPLHPADMTPRKIGVRIGYQLALAERKAKRMLADSEFLRAVERAQFNAAVRGMEPRDAKKVRLVIAGYKHQKEVAEQFEKEVPGLRQVILAIAGGEPIESASEFLAGINHGNRKAASIDLDDELSEYNEREEIVAVFSDYWNVIDRMKTRREITDFILKSLPEKRRRFFEGSQNGDGGQHQYVRFVERLRQTYYEPIGLRPRGRGRPENREKDS
jgi:hypothetical protein